MKLRAQVLFLAVLGGCSVLDPQPNRTRYFVLEATAVADRPAAAPRKGLAVGIGPIRLADYLRRSEIVRRVGDNQIRFSDEERWGEALEQSIARVLTNDVGSLLGIAAVTLPGPVNLRFDLEVALEILSFEADESGTVRLEARWALKRPHGERSFMANESHVVENATEKGTSATVAAMSRAIATLARELAVAIDSVGSKMPAEGRSTGPNPTPGHHEDTKATKEP